MSALDHPDANWYHPTFIGSAGKIGGLGRDAKEQWGVVPQAGALRPGLSAFRIARRPSGTTQMHYINAIDPGTAGSWLLPDVELDTVAPARLPI